MDNVKKCFINGVEYKCRTCFDPGSDIYSLNKESGKIKSWRDLLIEMIKLQTSDDDLLPNTICCKCSTVLQGAYDFMEQAHNVNKEYLNLIKTCTNPQQACGAKQSDLFSDCLEESAIDMPLDHYMPEIKLEVDVADQYNIVLLDKLAESDEAKLENNIAGEPDSLRLNELTEDYIQTGEQKQPYSNRAKFSEEHSLDENSYNDDYYPNDGSCSSSNESDYLPLKRVKKEINCKTLVKRKIGRKAPDYYDQIQQVNDRFVCLICQKTFSLRKDCGRHIASIHLRQTKYPCEFCGQNYSRKDKVRQHIKRMHSDRPVYPKTKRKEWIFGDRLYSMPTAWQLVECKLCDTKFNSTKELRKHLETHANSESLNNLQLSSEIVQHLFRNLIDLNVIKESICNDIKEKHWFKYYAVLNEYSYEMSISDTEIEDLENEREDGLKYKCELCEIKFSFKHQMFSHLKVVHCRDEISLKCGLCKMEFVSSDMLKQHSQTHCRNKNKVLLCTRCPAKFVWPENMKNHNCATKLVESSLAHATKDALKCNICERTFEVKTKLEKHLQSHSEGGKTATKTIIRCGLCSQSFEKLKHLRAHMPLHSDGKTGIDLKNSIYLKRFERSKTPDLTLLQQEIQNAFKKSQISRFYRAIDKEGNEMDIMDSDSEPEEDCNLEVKPEYKCELCLVAFKRRKFLLQHQNEHHNDVPLPFTCNDCTKQYVSKELLQQHLVRDCWNEHRRIAQQCEYCNARFIWSNNFVKHKDIQHKHQKQPRPQRASTLKCEYCEKVFIWPKDLVRHRKTHTEGKKFSCPHCERKFQRKDNLLAHIRIHDPDSTPTVASSSKTVDYILPHLIKPHGCKRIKCMICYSEHNRIRDLRSHLRSHRYTINFEKRQETETFDFISNQLYPEEPAMTEEELAKRIALDIADENNLERFYSITNENGYEVSLDSSETESDSDDNAFEVDSDGNVEENLVKAEVDKPKRIYKCDLCPELGFNRKFRLYDHHQKCHTWEEARHICIHCNGRFLSSYMLQLHYKKHCKNSKKRHFCRRCPLRFMWKSNLKAHVVMDHAHEVAKEVEVNRCFECFLCQRKFSQQRDLTRHMTSNHSADSEVHYCLLCPKTFYGNDHLNDHLSRHRLTVDDINSVESIIHSTCWPNGEKNIKCKICGLEFSNMTDLSEHLSPANPQNVCGVQHSIANYSITNHKGFELHLELDSDTDSEDMGHNNEDEALEQHKEKYYPYTCLVCNVSCKRKYQMAQHQRSMHNYEGLVLKCENCIFRTVCQKILDYHKTTQCFNTEKQYQCVRCKFKFMWQENLENHIAMLHPPKENVQIQDEQPVDTKPLDKLVSFSKNDPNIFECMDCHRRYNRRDRYKAHFKKFHNNDTAAAPSDGNTSNSKVRKQGTPKKDKNFLCAFCGLSFSNNSNLTVHMRRHTGEKPFKCDLCDMAFPRSSDLHAHRRTHTGEKPYKCMYCEKSFSRQYKLNVHTRIHTGERPYQCTYCEKSFIQSNDLTLHLRRHTGERPYLCDICGEGFICATSLKQHRNSKGHLENNPQIEERLPNPPHFEMNF